jgi:hypothetical protein
MKCVCGYEEKFIQSDPADPDSLYPDNKTFYRAGLNITIDKQEGEWNCNRFVRKDVFVCPECGTLKIIV